jgi:hypothetical protein
MTGPPAPLLGDLRAKYRSSPFLLGSGGVHAFWRGLVMPVPPRYEDVTVYSSSRARIGGFENYWLDLWALEVDLFSRFIIRVD